MKLFFLFYLNVETFLSTTDNGETIKTLRNYWTSSGSIRTTDYKDTV